MVILTQKRITDNGNGYFKNCIDYAYKEKPEEGEKLVEVTGYGVSQTNPTYTYNQMYAVKKYFDKTGDNPVMHFIVSYDNSVTNENVASMYTANIADLFKDQYQMITALHKEDQGGSQYHAHIIINTVDYNTGKLYHSGIMELKQLAMNIHNITGCYCKPYIER